MKDGLRFVDCDMHIMEPADLFQRYLDPKFKDRITTLVGADGKPNKGWIIDGIARGEDDEFQQYRKPIRSKQTQGTLLDASLGHITSSRSLDIGAMDFAIERDFDAEAQVMAMEMEGIDIAVLFPTDGLNLTARDNMDPHLSAAICRAYNNWIHEFCQYSPDHLKFAAMLPMHDVNLACQELLRGVKELGAVASFVRPNIINGRFWHSNYWEPLYSLHEELDVAWGFHEGTGVWDSHMNTLYGENRFYRHVASHWIEMQQALIAQIIGGVFEFHPSLRVAYLEAQNSWVPGLLTRIGWDYPNYRETHAPYLSLTPMEYFERNCWAAVEGSEPEIGPTAQVLSPERMCMSTDYPHFDANFPNVSTNLLNNVPRDIAAKILYGGALIHNLDERDFEKADTAAEARRKTTTTSEASAVS